MRLGRDKIESHHGRELLRTEKDNSSQDLKKADSTSSRRGKMNIFINMK